MQKVAAAHCNPKKQPALNHNDRTNDNAKTITKELTHLNEYSCSSDEVRKKIDTLYKKAYDNFSKYCENKNGVSKSGKPKGLQNFTKKEKCYHEFIYEISEHTTMEQCQELTEKIAELTGFTPLQIAIHRDEIHQNAKGEMQTHYHAHAVFFTLDKDTGLQLARQEASLNKQNLSKIQTLTAETLKMDRGENRLEKGLESPKYIQDYKIYSQYKEMERKLQEKWFKKQKEIEAKIKELERKEQELKNKEAELDKREKVIQDFIDQLESKHKEKFERINNLYENKKSLVKNIFTFGKHNRRIEDERQEALMALATETGKADLQYKEALEKVNEEKEKLRKECKNYQRQVEKKEVDIENLKRYNKEYSRKLNEYEKKLIRLDDSILEIYFPKILQEKQEQMQKRKQEQEQSLIRWL
jgi:hypothetical protein